MANSNGNFHLAVKRNAISVKHVPTDGQEYEPQNLQINFQRTIRVPDNLGVSYLPPGMGDFPLYQVKHYSSKFPAGMVKRGGVFFAMHQKEAMWIRFYATRPFMIKVYAGGVNVVSGEHAKEGPEAQKRRSDRKASGQSIQDYVVPPNQYWLDGFAVAPGIVRQFVAMPLGDGYSAEAQLTGEETIGGLQLEITPAKPVRRGYSPSNTSSYQAAPMGIAPGGRVNQFIVPDQEPSENWMRDATLTVPVQILNREGFRSVTGAQPHPSPLGVQVYATAGLPFFNLDESKWAGSAVAGHFQSLKSVNEIEQARGLAAGYEPDVSLPVVRLDAQGRRVHVDLTKVSDPQGLLNPEGPHREVRSLEELESEVDRESISSASSHTLF